MLEDADTHVVRVKDRAEAGGHYVAEKTVRRRFDRSRENIAARFTEFDEVLVLDNTSADGPVPLASYVNGSLNVYVDGELTEAMKAAAYGAT